MDNDIVSKPPTQGNSSNAPVIDADSDNSVDNDSSVRIFDITPDLNISPAKDEVEAPSNVSIPESIIKTLDKAPINLIKPIDLTKPVENITESNPIQPNIEVKPLINVTAVQPTTAPVIAPIPNPVTPTQSFGPANPPTKTIGLNKLSFTKPPIESSPIITGTVSLQDAVSTINEQVAKETAKPAEIHNDPNVKPIRTYESDIAEAMAKKRLSSASIAIAEDNKKQEIRQEVKQEVKKEPVILSPEQKNPTSYIGNSAPITEAEDLIQKHSMRNWALGLISLILICGGVFAGYYIYLQSPIAPSKTPPAAMTTAPVPSTNTTAVKTPAKIIETPLADSIIKSDSQIKINTDGLNQPKILALIRNEVGTTQTPNTIKEIILTESTNGKAQRISSGKAMSVAELSAPSIFNRSLSPTWMFGTYAGSSGTKDAFVIVKNEFFQNAFAGMIQWEKTMPEDIKQYLYSGSPSSTVSSSTNSSNFTLRGQFKDRIVKNKDVREYVADDGRIIFLYSFVSNDKLVITNSEAALQEIINRLEKSTFVR